MIIAGRAHLPGDDQWQFQEPSLTTWEARELGDWLMAVAAGQVSPLPLTVREDDQDGLQRFMEPNLAFSVAQADDTEVTIRVHLSLEAAPPARSHDEDHGLYSFFVTITCARDEVRLAGEQWAREIAAFPIR
jgi:hypothetical protein